MTNLINAKIAQMEAKNQQTKQRFKQLDNEFEEEKKEAIQENQDLADELERLEYYGDEQDDELKELDREMERVKAAQEKKLQDMKDRIKAIRMGKETYMKEHDGVMRELRQEKMKTDVYLDKDREKLAYAKEVMQSRWLVMRSYEQEWEREQKRVIRLNPDIHNEMTAEEMIAHSRAELRKMQAASK